MLIDCPACARSYNVSRADIGEEGRTVICPRCDARWFVDGDGTSTYIPPDLDHGRRGATIEHEFYRVERAPLRRRVLPAAAAALCLVAMMGALGARERIVRLAPRAAGLYAAVGLPVNVRGLEIAALAPSRPAEAPNDVVVSGSIRNVAKRRVAIPQITYEVRDAAGATLVSWTERAGAKTLGTGNNLPFVSSPHRLPAEAHSVLVRFEDAEPVKPLLVARRTGF